MAAGAEPAPDQLESIVVDRHEIALAQRRRAVRRTARTVRRASGGPRPQRRGMAPCYFPARYTAIARSRSVSSSHGSRQISRSAARWRSALARSPDLQVGLADVLVRAAMARIELDRALVVSEGLVVLLEVAVRVAEVVLQVRVVRIAARGDREALHGFGPVLRVKGLLAGGVVLVALHRRRDWPRTARRGSSAHRADSPARSKRHRGAASPHRGARATLARAISGRVPSPLAASAVSRP